MEFHIVGLSIQLSPLALFLISTIAMGLAVFSMRSRDATLVRFWQTQTTAGVRDEWFPWTRAIIRSFTGTRDMAFEGYSKYSVNKSTFLLSTADRGTMVVIPPAYIKAVYNLPERLVAAHDCQNETIQTDYTLHPKIVYNNFHLNVLRNQLTRDLGTLTDAIREELGVGFEKTWGNSDDWKEVEAWPSCMRIISGASNRAFIGLPLCRDQELLDDLRAYAMEVFRGATALNTLPKSVRPFFGAILKWRFFGIAKKCLKKCAPEIEKRLDENKRKRENPAYDWTPPNDGLQWVIEEAYKSSDPEQLTATLIGYRFLFLNFVSMHSTSFTITNTLLDLYSSPGASDFIAGLREEYTRVVSENGGVLTKAAVSKMVRFDSTLRESMRFSNFGIMALPRMIRAKDGVTLPNGTTLPYGACTLIPMEPIHRDEAIYPHASVYNAFRFCEPGFTSSILPEQQGKGSISTDPVEATTLPSISLPAAGEEKFKSTVTLDDAFVSFGISRHACPGRFFALYEMKLMLAHIVMNYDIKPLEVRPEQFSIMWLRLRSETAKISVRKRVNSLA